MKNKIFLIIILFVVLVLGITGIIYSKINSKNVELTKVTVADTTLTSRTYMNLYT